MTVNLPVPAVGASIMTPFPYCHTPGTSECLPGGATTTTSTILLDVGRKNWDAGTQSHTSVSSTLAMGHQLSGCSQSQELHALALGKRQSDASPL